jgi:hypothetical protein
MSNNFELDNLLRNIDGIVRVPFLIKGRLILPPAISLEKVLAAFAGIDKDVRYLRLPEVQIIRQPVIDRRSMRYTGEYLYQVLPSLNPRDLIETDFDSLVSGPYALSTREVLDYLESLVNIVAQNYSRVKQILELCRFTAEYPDIFLDSWLGSLSAALHPRDLAAMIDRELSFWGRPGREFLDGWVDLAAGIIPGTVEQTAKNLFQENPQSDLTLKTSLRAFPTRQLHITAGNAPEIPLVSALRAILTKSAAVIKSPQEAVLTGTILALAVANMPDHPLTRHLSLVYWQGGDESIERELFQPGAFDRIVVWGSPETVNSVRSRSLYTRTICFNPRYSLSMIGKEAFNSDLQSVAEKASRDSLIFNQKACTASLVHYLEGSQDQVDRYAEVLLEVLKKWDERIPQFIAPETRGRLKLLKRGKYAAAHWYINEKDGEFCSGVVVMPGEFDILDHPACRLVIVRCVNDLRDVLGFLHPGVSTVGIFPEDRRTELRDYILARGVSAVLPLGQCEKVFAGMPHDGIPVLSHLVDWKTS